MQFDGCPTEQMAGHFQRPREDFFASFVMDGKAARLDTVQDFLIKLSIKPRMHLWEISIFSLNNGIVRPTKIMNRADKNWAHF